MNDIESSNKSTCMIPEIKALIKKFCEKDTSSKEPGYDDIAVILTFLAVHFFNI